MSPATARSAQAIAPVKVATGEMCQNRIMFKQFIAEGAIDIVQIDACRMGGLNEVLAVLLIAAKYGLPVWPHAGGVGLCEYVQHLSMIDYVAVSGTKEGRVIEYVDHLHEHFLDPCVIRERRLHAADAAGLLDRDEARLDRSQHLPPVNYGCTQREISVNKIVGLILVHNPRC